jgi:hypothetical protein
VWEQEFKEKGNYLYKEGAYKAAAGQYHRALLYMKVLIILDPINPLYEGNNHP